MHPGDSKVMIIKHLLDLYSVTNTTLDDTPKPHMDSAKHIIAGYLFNYLEI